MPMRLVRVGLLGIVFLLGCRRETSEERTARLHSDSLYVRDASRFYYSFRAAIAAAQLHKSISETNIEFLQYQLNNLANLKAENPRHTADYDNLVSSVQYWPLPIAEGTVYQDSCTQHVVKEEMTKIKWGTYGDLVGRGNLGFRLDTILLGWNHICSKRLGLQLSVPSYYETERKDDDSTIYIQLKRVDTSGVKYFSPHVNNILKILVTRSSDKYESMARRCGFYQPANENGAWYTDFDGQSVEVSSMIDSAWGSLDIGGASRDSKDTVITLRFIRIDRNQSIYLQMNEYLEFDFNNPWIFEAIYNSFDRL